MKKTVLAAASILLCTSLVVTGLAGSKTGNVSISYVPPKNPELDLIYTELVERRSLEKLQEFLQPYRLPRTLTIKLTGCDGEADAFYGDDEITICYEYVDILWKRMPPETTPAGIEPIDTVIGPFFDTCLHEFAHALFDMLALPVFGRQEDAADQVSAYIYLQLGLAEARRLIMGTAYAYLTEELKNEPRLSLSDFSDEHSTPAQRAYNVLCMAYGADKVEFADFVSKGHLPQKRAEACEAEYEQIQDAYEALVFPHIDQELASEVFDRTWLRKTTDQRVQ